MPYANDIYILSSLATEDLGLSYSPGQLLYYLLVVCVTIALTYFSTKFIAQKMGKSNVNTRQWVRVLGVYNLSRDNKLLLVKVGKSLMILAENRQGVTVVKELSSDESEMMLHVVGDGHGNNETGGMSKVGVDFAYILKQKMSHLGKKAKREKHE